MKTGPYTIGMMLPVYTLKAHNDAADSANKIHDDRVAVQYGFRGGLVPGVTVYAYMTYPLMQQLGEAWLAQGRAHVKLVKPCYEGDQITIKAMVSDSTEDAVSFDVRGSNAQKIDCGVGSATLLTHPMTAPALDAVPLGAAGQPCIPVSWNAIVVGEPLPVLRFSVSKADNQAYCRTYEDDLDVYQGDKGCVHPGFLLQQCNRIFAERFQLGPWMHVASEIAMYRPCRVGDTIEVRGVPVDKFEKKGHEFVVLDVLLSANSETAQRVTHTCIYRPRKREG